MSKLKVAKLGEKAGEEVLRKKAVPVKDIKAKEIQELIDEMIKTMEGLSGVGIAAPQVFKSLRIFVIHSHLNARYPNAPKFGPLAVINPKISEPSEGMEKDWEGCLSIPGVRGLVPRHKSLVLEYTTRERENRKERFEGFLARIIQHETDHLDGILFIDKVENGKDLMREQEYQEMIVIKNGNA
jgi:peptide deformylase